MSNLKLEAEHFTSVRYTLLNETFKTTCRAITSTRASRCSRRCNYFRRGSLGPVGGKCATLAAQVSTWRFIWTFGAQRAHAARRTTGLGQELARATAAVTPEEWPVIKRNCAKLDRSQAVWAIRPSGQVNSTSPSAIAAIVHTAYTWARFECPVYRASQISGMSNEKSNLLTDGITRWLCRRAGHQELDWVVVDEELHRLQRSAARDRHLPHRAADVRGHGVLDTADTDPSNPETRSELRAFWKNMHKIVSRRLEHVLGNATLDKGKSLKNRQIRARPGKKMTSAAPRIASTLMRLGLIDEYWLTSNRCPGDGTRMSRRWTTRQPAARRKHAVRLRWSYFFAINLTGMKPK